MTKELEKGEKAAQPTLIARRTAESPVQRAAFSGVFLMMLITMPAQTPL